MIRSKRTKSEIKRSKTETAKRKRNGTTVGYKISAGGSFISPRTYMGDQSEKGPFYFSNTVHLSRGKVTGFCQFNFGNYTTTFQTGVNYRLTKSKNL